jgi:very-short-patch-repair endonuclease
MDPRETTTKQGIPVTTPLTTLIDLASTLSDRRLEAAINEADKLNLIRAHEIPLLGDAVQSRPGAARLKRAARTHKRTDSSFERTMLRMIRKAGLPVPETQVVLDGMRVDFYWPELGLVVEADGERYHRTPSQQAADRRRDRLHAAAGRTSLRFDQADVEAIETLRAVIARLSARQ